MKFVKLKVFWVALLLILSWEYSVLCIAHEAHSHPMNKTEITEQANAIIRKAVSQGKLESSWEKANSDDPSVVDEETGGQWVIKYTNDKIDTENKNLYVFFTLDGKYIAMNYTGR